MTKGKKKSHDERAIEIRKAVMASRSRQKRLMSKTFWGLFYVDYRSANKIKEIRDLIETEGLELSVKSGAEFDKSRTDPNCDELRALVPLTTSFRAAASKLPTNRSASLTRRNRRWNLIASISSLKEAPSSNGSMTNCFARSGSPASRNSCCRISL